MEVLHYMAAVAVASPGRVRPGMDSLIVPAGTYAAFSCPLAQLLPSSGYLPTPGPYFERYDQSFDPARRESAVGVFLPVRRRGTGVTS
jgi:predicted transcriptional regulator YdeE